MSGEFEAAGAMATAGLVAGVIEGREGVASGEGACLNCGAKVDGRFCAQCGQAVHAHRSLMRMGEEVLHGLFNFDTKVWRTLPMVIFRPGTLTNGFVYGKRARYVSPLALFLLCVFLLFFVFSLIPPPADVNLGGNAEARQEAQDHLAEARETLRDAQQRLGERRADRSAAAPSIAEQHVVGALTQAVALAHAEVARREAALAQLDAAERARAERPPPVRVTTTPTPMPAPDSSAAPAESTAAPADSTAAPDPTSTTVGVSLDTDNGDSLEDVMRQVSRDNITIDGRPILNDRVRHKLSNPDLFFYQLQEAASKFSFLLVPISLPFISLLFLWKRGVTLYDHAVFALYSLSFAALLFVVVLAFGSIPWMQWLPGTLIMFGLPVHTFFHLGGAYKLGVWSALWRTFFMMIFALVALALFFAFILFVGLVG